MIQRKPHKLNPPSLGPALADTCFLSPGNPARHGYSSSSRYPFCRSDLGWADFFGVLFINALKMMIVPLVATSMIAGVLQLGSSASIGSIGGKTLLYYSFSGLFAVIVGLVLVNWIEPGRVDPSTARALLGEAAQDQSIIRLLNALKAKIRVTFWLFFSGCSRRIFLKPPPTMGNSSASFSSLFSSDSLPDACPSPCALSNANFGESSQKVILGITEWIIRFAPIGVFGLVFPILYRAPIGELMQTLSAFFFTVFLGLLIHLGILLSLCLKCFTSVSPSLT